MSLRFGRTLCQRRERRTENEDDGIDDANAIRYLGNKSIARAHSRGREMVPSTTRLARRKNRTLGDIGQETADLLTSVLCPLSSVLCLLSSVFCPLSSVLSSHRQLQRQPA